MSSNESPSVLSFTVRPDGVLTVPLIGDLQVAGKAPSQVREEIKKKLSTFIKEEPTVNVTVTGFNSYRFIVAEHAPSAARAWSEDVLRGPWPARTRPAPSG